MKIFNNAVCPCFKAISFIKIEIMMHTHTEYIVHTPLALTSY